MKKVAYFLLFISTVGFSQGTVSTATITLAAETSDTTYYWINLVKTDNPSLLMFDFTNTSNDLVQISLYYLDITSTDTISCMKDDFNVDVPVTLVKGESDHKNRFFGKTSYVATFNISHWKTPMLGYMIVRNGATGTIKRKLFR
jgi:hypothetical protein